MTVKLLEESYELTLIITSPPFSLEASKASPLTPPKLFPTRITNDLGVVKSDD